MSDLELRKAAQQALEALMWHDETVQTTADSEAIDALRAALARPPRTSTKLTRVSEDRLPMPPQAIAAAREDSAHREAGPSRRANVVRTPRATAQPEPEQEPVAFDAFVKRIRDKAISIYADPEGRDILVITLLDAYVLMHHTQHEQLEAEKTRSDQRFAMGWKVALEQMDLSPLTDEEINEIGNGLNGIHPPISRQRRDLLVVRKAEAAHGIKEPKP
jgi:hypothetical protein